MKIAAVFILPYLLFGTVADDWVLRGETTADYGAQLILGAAVLLCLFLIGARSVVRYHRFLGFSLLQWMVLPPLALGVGIALRVYAL